MVFEELLETLSSRYQYVCNSNKAFDFSTLYTTITHTLLKSRIKELIQHCFSKRNGEQRYQYLVIGSDKCCFVKNHAKANQMLYFLIVETYRRMREHKSYALEYESLVGKPVDQTGQICCR
jgi:hypothetical protein